MAMHRQQAAAYRARMAQHRQKQRAGFRDVTQRLFKMTARVAQMTQGGGVDPGDVAVTHHHVKHAQNGLRLANKQRLVAQIDKRAAQLEVIIQHARFFIGGEREDRLVEQLQQHLVKFADAARDAVEIFHHMLNRLVAFAFITQALSHAQLTIKQ